MAEDEMIRIDSSSLVKNDKAPESMIEFRDSLVKDYYGADGFVERVKNKEQSGDLKDLILEVVWEIFKESDNLLGNSLIAMHNSDIVTSSAISDKRIEALGKAAKALQAKLMLEGEAGINIDSPAMMVVFHFFMNKVKDVIVKMKIGDEFSDEFFRELGDSMMDWKKELKRDLKDMQDV